MRVGVISINDVIQEGYRLTGGFHVSEDERAIASLRRLTRPMARVRELVKGRGVFRGPIYKGMFVDDASQGEPYVSARDLVNADVTPATYLSRKHGRLLDELRLHEGMILLTCSGMNLGKAIWARQEFNRLVASGDLIRIEPDPNEAPPGYLFAFLASRHGHALIRKQIYGGHIKHIDPEHVAGLPVPRFGTRIETASHELIIDAAKLWTSSTSLLEKAKAEASKSWGIDPDLQLQARHYPDTRVVSSSTLAATARFDAFFHGAAATASDSCLRDIAKRVPMRRVGDADVSLKVFETTRFGRVSVDDPLFGVPFLSIADMMRGDPKAASYISRKQAVQVNAIVHAGWLVLPRVGQLQGVFGTVSYVAKHLDGAAVSDNNIRIVPVGEDEGGYLWAALSTDLLYQQIIRRACGASIPYLDSRRVADIPVPWPDERQRQTIASLVKEAMVMRSKAARRESDAVSLVEQAIEKGAAH
jgi:type I restriction enzyme, S subunit